MSVFVACAHYQDMAGNYREQSVFVSVEKCDQSVEASTTALVQCVGLLTDWANKHFAVPMPRHQYQANKTHSTRNNMFAQDTSTRPTKLIQQGTTCLPA
ncbi:hypothetical protein HaLaN_26209, partial [Haematococcus lacustris]